MNHHLVAPDLSVASPSLGTPFLQVNIPRSLFNTNARKPRIAEERLTVVQAWPEQMRADTAVEFCGERSVAAFRRAVGTLYPPPYSVPGKGDRWSKQELESAIMRLRAGQSEIRDAADIL